MRNRSSEGLDVVLRIADENRRCRTALRLHSLQSRDTFHQNAAVIWKRDAAPAPPS